MHRRSGRSFRTRAWLAGLVFSCGSAVPAPAGLAPAQPLSSSVVEPGVEPPEGEPVEIPSPGVEPKSGWLGVGLEDRPAAQAGVMLVRVLRGSPAAAAGLLVGDVVMAVNGQAANNSAHLVELVQAAGAGSRASLAITRGGQHRLLSVPLIADPGLEGRLRLGFVGSPAPPLEQVVVAQGDFGGDLNQLRGRVVILEFWASFCSACRALSPTLNAWHEQLVPLGGAVVSITSDPLAQAARDAFQLGMRYPVLSDPESRTATLYEAMALPTIFVVDPQGVVRHVSVGIGAEQLEQVQRVAWALVAERDAQRSAGDRASSGRGSGGRWAVDSAVGMSAR